MPPRIASHRDAPNPHDFRAAKLLWWASFSLRSARRRPARFFVVWAGTVAAVALGAWMLPATYEVRCEFVATSHAFDPRADDAGADGPTHVAAAAMLGDDALRAIVRDTGLVEAWRKSRSPLQRAIDAVRSRSARGRIRDEQVEALASTLAKRLVVTARDDGSVEMTLHWPDAAVAYRVLDAAQETFLEKAHGIEVDSIAEAIAVLETRARAMRVELQRRIANLSASDAGAGVSLGLAASRHGQDAPAADAMRLRIALAGKRRAIADILELRRRHAAELETWIATRAASGADPDAVAEAQRSVRTLLADSPQLRALRDAETFLSRELKRRAIPAGNALESSDPDLPWLEVGVRGDAAFIASARSEAAAAVRRYDGLLDRIEAARVALDLASLRFTERYLVVVPPEVPPAPIRPSDGPILFAALLDGLIVALLATALADRRRGEPLEPLPVEGGIGAWRVPTDRGA